MSCILLLSCFSMFNLVFVFVFVFWKKQNKQLARVKTTQCTIQRLDLPSPHVQFACTTTNHCNNTTYFLNNARQAPFLQLPITADNHSRLCYSVTTRYTIKIGRDKRTNEHINKTG